MDFWKSKEWQELSGLLSGKIVRTSEGDTAGGQYFNLLNLLTPDGKIVRTLDGKMVLAAAVFDDIYPGSNFIEITDEKLLAKLRNIKGQFYDEDGRPIFYYEYLMSTADFKVFSETGKIPTQLPTGMIFVANLPQTGNRS